MNTLSTYFLRFYLSNFLKVIAGLSFVTILIDMVELSRRTTAIVEVGFADVALLSALRAPSFIQNIFPFVVLFAAMMTLLTLNKRQELVITRASGMSAWQFIAPLCLGSLLLGVATVLLLNPVATAGLAVSDELQIDLRIKDAQGGDALPWFRQKTADGYVIVGAEQSALGGKRLGRPSFFFFDANDNPGKRMDADTAELIDGQWVLKAVSVFNNGSDVEKLPTFSMPASIDSEMLAQALTPPETISFFQLSNSMESARAFGSPDSPYAMQWHSLAALPALLIAMTLIAATVSLRFARFGQSSAAILGGVLSGFLLYVLSALAEALGSAGVIAPIIAAWLPVITASFFGVTFLLHREDG